MLQPETPLGAQPNLPSDRARSTGVPALARDDTRCGVCRHEEHGETACPKPYCLCDGDAP
jgi:hypothetical protein